MTITPNADLETVRKFIGSFDSPDRVQETGGVRQEVVRFADASIARIFEPVGWRWSTHVRPIVGTASCQAHHIGVILSGHLGVTFDDCRNGVVGPGEAFDFPPGHDGYVVGNEPVVLIEWGGVTNWLEPREEGRALVTLLITDIVGSTDMLSALGDRAWRGRLAGHDDVVRRAVRQQGGHEVKSTGDGFLLYFDAPGQAIAAALDIRSGVSALGIPVRQGIHVGEVRLIDGDVQGLAVHEAARIASAAQGGEILTSEVTHVLASAGGFVFEPKGERELKGIEAPRNLFAIV